MFEAEGLFSSAATGFWNLWLWHFELCYSVRVAPTCISRNSEAAHETAPNFFSGVVLTESTHYSTRRITLLDRNYAYAASDTVPGDDSPTPRPSRVSWVTFSLQMETLLESHVVTSWTVKDISFCCDFSLESTWNNTVNATEPNRVVGCWWTLHTLRCGVKVRRLRWGLPSCWSRARRLGSCPEWFWEIVTGAIIKSQRENQSVCSNPEFRRELTYYVPKKMGAEEKPESEVTLSLPSLMAVCLFSAGGNMSRFQRGFVNLALTLPKTPGFL